MGDAILMEFADTCVQSDTLDDLIGALVAPDGDLGVAAGITRASGLITCVSSDKDNLVITLTARQTNPKLRIIAQASRADMEDKLRRARLYFGVLMESPEETLNRLIQTDARLDPAARGIILAAMHAVWSEEVESLYGLIERMAETAEQPLVQQTAEWVMARAGKVPPGKGLISKGEAAQMAPMAHIEMMVFLAILLVGYVYAWRRGALEWA